MRAAPAAAPRAQDEGGECSGKRGRMNTRLTTLAARLRARRGVGARRARRVRPDRRQRPLQRARRSDEHFGQQVVRAPRGAILDRNGYPLATTVDAYDVYIDRPDWQDLDVARRRRRRSSRRVIGQKPDDLVNEVRASRTRACTSRTAASTSTRASRSRDADAPGLRLVQTTKRFYPEGDLASTLLGFVGRDHVGLTGIEADFDRELGGIPGTIYFERDSIGNRIALGSERIGQKPKPGGDITSHDRPLHPAARRGRAGRRRSRRRARSAARSSSWTRRPAQILAMASRPGFKLSQLDLNNPNQALFRNRAVTDVYEPGSVFKTLTAAMAIDLGLVTPESHVRRHRRRVHRARRRSATGTTASTARRPSRRSCSGASTPARCG